MKVPKIQGIGKQKLGRIFGACFFSLTVILALGIIALAAGGSWEESGSYSLVIQKLFDANTPADVREEAEKQTYSFRIKGYRMTDAGSQIPIDEVVEINRDNEWETKPFYSSGPIHVTVTEITNNVTLRVNGADYNMGNSRVETSTEFTDSVQQRSLNSNGTIVISRPSEKLDGNGNTVDVTTTSTFLITSEWEGEESEKPDGWEPYHNTVTLAPGKEAITLSGLSAGRYTIQDLSVSGYRIQLGARSQAVEAGKTGEFYINSKPGKLVITAGGDANDGNDHYFTIDRISAPWDAEPFTQRTTEPVQSGKTYTLDNLPRGHYKVTEYTVSDIPSEFTVKVPQTIMSPKTYAFNKQYFGNSSAQYVKLTVGGDWITDFKYGPLRNASNQVISSSYSYYFGIRYRKTADQEGYTATTWSTPRKANTIYSFTTPIYPRTDSTLAFAVWNVTATTGDHIDLSWTENTRTEVSYTRSGLNADHTFTVDDRGWMEITAPAVSDIVAAGEIEYIYTIRDKDGNVQQTLKLEPGQTERVEELDAGSYLVTETAEVEEPQGFTMEISGNPYGSTEAGTSFDITTMGTRSLNITKEKGAEGSVGDGGRTYTFTVEKYKDDSGSEMDSSFKETVTLKAGESSAGTGQLINLPTGRYKVTPTDDKTEVYKLQCSDTSQVRAEVPSTHAATVTFTNVFTKGDLGYRYVHEYYYRDSSGKYVYEGNSPITTVGGRTDSSETYTSVDIDKKPYYNFTDLEGNPQSYSYAYLSSAYGYVAASSTGDTEDSDGLRTSNRYTETAGEANITTYYRVDSTLTQNRRISVTPNNEQIIILRYFRVLPEDQKGSYNYVHIYYSRDENGDHWEGTSVITPVTGQLGLRYTAETVSLRPDYQPEGAEMPYHYTYNNRPSYGVLSSDHNDPPIELNRVSDPEEPTHRHYKPNSDAGYVIATEAGDQIIILRYYREVLPEDRYGSYKIVHEYYFAEPLEGQDTEDPSGDTDSKNEDGQDGVETPSTPEGEDKTVPPENEEEESAPEGEDKDPNPEEDDGQEPAPEGAADEGSAPAEDAGQEPAPEDTAPGEGSAPAGAENTGAASEDAGEIAPLRDAAEVPAADPAGEGPEAEEKEPAPEAEDTEAAAPVEDAPEIPPEDQEKEEPAPAEKEEPGQDHADGTAPQNDGTDDQDNTDDETEDTGDGTTFSGTLYSDERYSYKFEGAREIVSIQDKLSTSHRGEEVALRTSWTPINGSDTTTSYVYDYIDAVYGMTKEDGTYEVIDGKAWVECTESGDQIIILRYYRVEGGAEAPPSDDDQPDTPPDDPSPGPSPGPSPSHKPDPTPDPGSEPEQPTDPENPDGPENPDTPETPSGPDDPQTPADPGYPTELPDPNNPGSPDRVTIWENGVPTTYVKLWDPEKEKWVYIPETEVPTTNKDVPTTTTIISQPSRVPKTGDAGSFWSALAAAAMSGLGALRLPFWKKKD